MNEPYLSIMSQVMTYSPNAKQEVQIFKIDACELKFVSMSEKDKIPKGKATLYL